MPEESRSDKNVSSKIPQYISAAIAGLSGFATGMAICPLVIGSNNNKYISFNYEDDPYLNYINFGGTVVGTLLSGFASDYFGPKRVIQISAFPLFMSRLITAYCRTVYGFYAALLLLGFAAGVSFFSAINYSIDIAERRQRGSVALMYFALHVLGVVCAYSIERNVDDFILQALIPSVVPVIYLTALSFIPESPVHMCMNDDLPQACSSLQWLRGPDYDIENEIAGIQAFTKSKNERLPSAPEPEEKFFSRKTFAFIFSVDAVFAALYILYFRSVDTLNSMAVEAGTREVDQWTSVTNLKLPVVLLLMWLVKKVELAKLILTCFGISAFGSILIEVFNVTFQEAYFPIPYSIIVSISSGNVILVTLILWEVFDKVELRTTAIPTCLTMQLMWIITCQTAPDYGIPSAYLTAVNVLVGFVVIRYFLVNVIQQKVAPTKTIILQNLA